MFDRVTTAWQLLRPRSLAANRKSLDDLVAEVRELKREQAEGTRAIREQLDALAVRESQLRAIHRADVEQEPEIDGLSRILDETRVVPHVQRAIAAAPLHLSPFPYAVVPDLLPPDFYAALLRAIPPVELFADRPFNKQHLTVPLTVAPLYSRRVWKFMAHVVNRTAMQPPILEKFRQPLGEWIALNWPSLAHAPLSPPVEFKTGVGRILARGRGYRIPPHRDPKWGFLTVIVYLAKPEDDEAWGTQLYEVDADREAVGATPHWIDARQCRAVVDVPFKPNTALVLLNSVGAHGAAIPDEAQPEDLRRYVLQYHIGPSASALKTLQALLPDERRPLWAGKVSDE
jgi:hypothetical protein